jgi:PAS domain-containing protein
MGQSHGQGARSYATRNSSSFSFSTSSTFKTIPEDSIYLKKQSSTHLSGNEDIKLTNRGTGKSSSHSASTSVSIKKDNVFNYKGPADGQQINLEDFISNDLIPFKTWEGQKLCQEDERIRKAFVTYITSFDWMEKLGRRVFEILSRSIPSEEVSQHVLFHGFLVHPRSRDSSSSHSRNRTDDAAKMSKCSQLKTNAFPPSFDLSCLTVDEQSALLLATLWPIFVASVEFMQISSSQIANPARSLCSPAFGNDTIAEREKIRRVKDIFYHIVMDLKDEDIDNMLAEGRWLERVLSFVDNAPVALFVASPEPKSRLEFPLVYVNSALEIMSKFDREEVLGCSMLQSSPQKEEEYTELVSKVISRGIGLKVVLTNVRKDKSEFINFLSMRPVYSRDGIYTHIVGVQCDASKEKFTLEDLTTAEEFQLIVSNILQG